MVKHKAKTKLVGYGYGTILFVVVLINLFISPNIQALGDSHLIIPGAHRGSSVSHVENTLDALREAAADSRYQFIEIDVQFTKDRQIVVYHDTNLQRFQKLGIEIKNLTYAELLALSRYQVPLYEEALQIAGNKKINVEIKSQGDILRDWELVDAIIADAKKREMLPQILLSSISQDVVDYIQEAYPDLKVGKIYLLIEATFFPVDFFTEKFYEEATADYIMLHGVNGRNVESLTRLKPVGKTLVFWYFDDRIAIVDGQLW